MRVVIARWALGACWLVACSDPAARVKLEPVRPVEGSTCGDPTNPTELVVIGYARSGETVRTVPVDAAVPIGDFPEDTEQLGVEVRIGGAAVAIGKTAPFDFTALPDGTTIPIFMAPPDGFCPVGNLRTARQAPLVARAGDGVLVVGGVDAAGNPLGSAERYDPATGHFVDVVVPSVLGEDGFVGATLTSLPDGRVVLAGGPKDVVTIYNPTTHAFGESVLIESRAFHAAVAVADDQLLLLGGCSSIQAGACAGVVRLGSKVYEITDADTVREAQPGTSLRAGRIGASIFDIGAGVDGKRTFVMAGGLPPPSGQPALDAADVFVLGASDATAIFGSFAHAVALDGGAVLTAFAPDGDPPAGAASVFAPGITTARTVARAPDVPGVRLVALENGRVAGIGGDPAGNIVRYDPMIDLWERVDAGGPVTSAPVLHRLDDGSVLVLGGSAATAEAWIYRPPLVGASSGLLTVVTAGPARANVLTPEDPATVTRMGTDWLLSTGDAPLARALVGGPRMATGTAGVVAKVKAGGIGVVAQQTGPGHALLAELVPGAPARISQIDAGTQTTLCTGKPVAAFDPDTPETIGLEIADGRARVSRGGENQVTCEVGTDVGAWGVAAIGPFGQLAVGSVNVRR